MTYTITFLGTSALWPLPRLGCQCEICQSKDPKDKRLRPSLLIEAPEPSILFDVGPDFYPQILHHRSEKIKHVFITHSHHDHILGFDDLSRVYNRKGKITVYATDIALKNIKRIFRTATSRMLLKTIKSADEIKIDNLVIMPFAVKHTKNEKTLGFFITKTQEHKNTKAGVAYIPDCQDIPQLSLKIIKDSDILIVDGSSLRLQKFTDHWSIEEAIEKIKKWNLGASKLIFTHIGHLTGTHQELEKLVRQKSTKKLKIGIAYDGMEIILSQNSKPCPHC